MPPRRGGTSKCSSTNGNLTALGGAIHCKSLLAGQLHCRPKILPKKSPLRPLRSPPLLTRRTLLHFVSAPSRSAHPGERRDALRLQRTWTNPPRSNRARVLSSPVTVRTMDTFLSPP